MSAVAPPTDAEAESVSNRPYRRLVGVLFALAIGVICTSILRGVVRALDRLPSAATLERPAVVDTRALRACGEDLDKLEQKIRKTAGIALSELPPELPTWPAARRDMEVERITIVARCRLDEPTEDAAIQDLERAAERLEDLLRAYALLYDRHVDDGVVRSRDAREALDRANTALKSR